MGEGTGTGKGKLEGEGEGTGTGTGTGTGKKMLNTYGLKSKGMSVTQGFSTMCSTRQW